MKVQFKIFRGFTLVELLVVVTIVAILVTISVASYTAVTKRSRDAKRKSDVEQIRSALEMYRTDIGSYPDPSGSGIWTDATGLASTLVPTYLPAIPSDPQAPAPVYRYLATNQAAGNYYGYCLSALLEVENPPDSCSPDSVNEHNWGSKNP